MITIIFAFFCLVLIAKLLNDKWSLEEELDKERNNWLVDRVHSELKIELLRDTRDELITKLSLAGKNYIEMKNKLNEEIRLLKTKINANKKTKAKRQSRQTVQRTNKKKVQRLER